MSQMLDVVKAYGVGNQAKTIVVVIPKVIREKLGVDRGTRFSVEIDERNRIVYEPLMMSRKKTKPKQER